MQPRNTQRPRRSFVARNTLAIVALPSMLAASACEPTEAVRPGLAPQTSTLGISSDGATLYVALADRDEVRAVDAASGETKATVAIPGHPHRLTVLADGRVAVVARYTGTVSVVDVEAGRVDATVDVGSDPFGVVQSGDDLYVAVAGEGDLARVSLKTGRVVARVALPDAEPRGLAVTGGRIVVSHFKSGRLSVVEPGADGVRASIGMKLPSRSFFTPNQFDQVTVDPDDPAVVVAPHVECNNDPAQFGAGNAAFVGAPAAAYYNDGPTGFPAVVPGVSRADIDVGIVISDDTQDVSQSGGFAPEPAGPTSPVINPLNRTLLQDEFVNGPVAVALADRGALELVVARGSGNVVVRRTRIIQGEDSIIGVVDVGVGADSIVLSPDGGTAYVFNAFDQSVTSFAVPDVREAATRFNGAPANENQSGLTSSKRYQPLARYASVRHEVAPQALSADVVRGRELFHAVDQRLTQNGAISCASCHPGGAEDGTTWSFAEGPRQSPALWGGLTGSEPFHWDNSVRDIADISRATIIGRMGGSGLGKDDMVAIGAFLDTIPAPAPPTTVMQAGESIARGAAVFAGLGCQQCHGGVDLTDNQQHDVGTGAGFVERETMSVFASPSLKGLAHSAPYMHDGSARTMRDLVKDFVLTNRMVGAGTELDGRRLTPQQQDDLIAYLLSL
jgi:mono/diheme cytochrome c family protein